MKKSLLMLTSIAFAALAQTSKGKKQNKPAAKVVQDNQMDAVKIKKAQEKRLRKNKKRRMDASVNNVVGK